MVTTFAPTLDVLRKAAAGGKNMIVSHERPFWNRKPESVEKNPTYAVDGFSPTLDGYPNVRQITS
jgi:hypothetical protein